MKNIQTGKNRLFKNFFFTAALLGLVTISAFKPGPKKIFVLGDSISLQYGPDLEKYLAGQFTIERKAGDSVAFKDLNIPVGANGGDSRMVLQYLKLRLKDKTFHPDVMILNCGLHDIKREPGTNALAVSESDYRNNLENIYALVKAQKIPLIWVRTTGIIDSLHRKNKAFNRFNKDIIHYNMIADTVFGRHHVPEIDLYTFTAMQGEKRFIDHAHFLPEVRRLQAAFIAGFIEMWQSGKNQD
jgi:lysophospholipase L1-like esterase